jgi:hypothetical protein
MTRLTWGTSLLLVMGLSACGVPLDDTARRVAPERVPYNLLDPNPLPVPEPARTGTPSLVYVVKAERLRAVPMIVPTDAEPLEVLGLLDIAVGGVSDARTVLQPGDAVLAVLDDDGLLTVDVDPTLLQLPASEQVLAIAQIVLTMVEQPAVNGVVFTSGGQPVSVARTDGSIISGPARRADLADLVS